MALSITIELGDADLTYFRAALDKAGQTAAGKPAADIVKGALAVLGRAGVQGIPGFIGERIDLLEDMLAMLSDSAWAMPEADRRRVLDALAYFADPEDVIPDRIPVLGYLDDAVMIELCADKLLPELEAYEEFCDYRAEQARTRGVDPATVSHEDWLAAKRQALQDRMHERRRELGVGYGSSEGYGRKRPSYVNRSWRPTVDRIA